MGPTQAVLEHLVQTSRTLAWSQWTDLGVSSWESPHNDSLVELESLIAFTAQLWPFDPRLGAQAVDWTVRNMPLVSLHQIRSVLTRHRWGHQGPMADFGATAERFTHKKWPGASDARPLLTSLPGKASRPDLQKSSLQALKIRAVFGLGARAEIIRHLLFHDWPTTASQLAKELPYGGRQISNDLDLLHMAGMVRRQQDGTQQAYRLADPEALHAIVGYPRARLIAWGAAFRVLTELLDLYGDASSTALQSPRAEFAGRLRGVEPELRRLERHAWWRSPEEAAGDDVDGWVRWLLDELTTHL